MSDLLLIVARRHGQCVRTLLSVRAASIALIIRNVFVRVAIVAILLILVLL
ncbi:hypothetical protein QX201_013337 [Fusarium graminearum]